MHITKKYQRCFYSMSYKWFRRGLNPVPDKEVIAMYEGSHVPLEIMSDFYGKVCRTIFTYLQKAKQTKFDSNYIFPLQSSHGHTMKQFMDIFSLPEMTLLSCVNDYFMKHNIDYEPVHLYKDVKVWCHRSFFMHSLQTSYHTSVISGALQMLELTWSLLSSFWGLDKNRCSMLLFTFGWTHGQQRSNLRLNPPSACRNIIDADFLSGLRIWGKAVLAYICNRYYKITSLKGFRVQRCLSLDEMNEMFHRRWQVRCLCVVSKQTCVALIFCIWFVSLLQEAIGDVHVRGIMYRAVEADIGIFLLVFLIT